MKTTSWLTTFLLVFITIGCHNGKDENQNIVDSIFKEKDMDCSDEQIIDMPSLCHEIKVNQDFYGLTNFRAFTPASNTNIVLKNGQLFRSDAFHKINSKDQTQLTTLGVKTIIDLRSPEEINEFPNKLIPSIINSFNTPIGSDPAQLESLGITEEVTSKIRTYFLNNKFNKVDSILKKHNINLKKIRKERYEDFATKYNSSISKSLKILSDSTNYPIVFHCQGGKDRTGYLSAIIQKILGYSDQEILRDYLTTNLYTFNKLKKQFTNGPTSLRPAYGAHSTQIKAALDKINKTYGNFDNYLENVLLISKEEQTAIRKNLLVRPKNYNVSRFYKLEGVGNFRDIGGLKTKDGKTVKKGQVFRSSKLTTLTNQDIETLKDLGITKVIDLRSNSELDKEPENLPSQFKYLHRRVGKDDLDVNAFQKKFISGYWNGESFTQYMIEGNRQMITEGDFHFPNILRDIANNPGATVYHCAGGKDRTGVITAVLLKLLHVPNESIINDYLSTNIQQKEHYRLKEKKLKEYSKNSLDPKIYEAQKAHRAYIVEALNTIDDTYGGIENYFYNHLKLDSTTYKKLKNKLTY